MNFAPFLSSSTAEHSAVNRRVVCSNQTWGARKTPFCPSDRGVFFNEICPGSRGRCPHRPACCVIRHSPAALVAMYSAWFAMAPSALPHPHCAPTPSWLLSARRRGLRFTCGAFCGKRRSLLRRASSPQKVTLASATPFLTRALRLSLRYQPFAGNPAYTIFGKGTSRRCQPFAGNPAYTIFGKGTQMPPICHPALRPTE